VRPDDEAMDYRQPYAWNNPDNPGDGWLRQFYARTNRSDMSDRSDRSAPLYLMAGVWPGFNDQLVSWAWNPHRDPASIRPRVICRETSRGNTLDLTWRAYLDYLKQWAAGEEGAQIPAPLVQLVTWNDYAETTTLEPTRNYGRKPLEQCREMMEKARAAWRE
jgi:hypothetical protein